MKIAAIVSVVLFMIVDEPTARAQIGGGSGATQTKGPAVSGKGSEARSSARPKSRGGLLRPRSAAGAGNNANSMSGPNSPANGKASAAGGGEK
jgi:hypothetical protein